MEVQWDDVWWLCDVLEVSDSRCTVRYRDGGDVESGVELATRIRKPRKASDIRVGSMVEAYCDGLWRAGRAREVEDALCYIDFEDDASEGAGHRSPTPFGVHVP